MIKYYRQKSKSYSPTMIALLLSIIVAMGTGTIASPSR